MAEQRSTGDRDTTSADAAGIVDQQGAVLEQIDADAAGATAAPDEGGTVPGDGSVPQSEPAADVDDARQ